MAKHLDGRIRQTSSVDGRRISSVTDVRLEGVAPAAALRAVLEEPWSWWRRGRIRDWQREDDGGVRFVLWPIWPFVPSQVGIDMAAPAAAEENFEGAVRSKTVLAARFFAGFEGAGRFEILDLGHGSLFRSVWDGVEPRGPAGLLPVRVVHDLHVGAEGGTLPFPLPSGTGYPGLIERLRGV